MKLRFVRKPNFFIVGVSKAGTTSLYNYLNQHPQIFMSPIKEPNYFSKDLKEIKGNLIYNIPWSKDLRSFFNGTSSKVHSHVWIQEQNQYRLLFKNVTTEMAIGEASPSYLQSMVASREIKTFNPSAKIIILLRDPIERAFSHYLMDLRLNEINIKTTFLQAVKSYPRLLDRGLYYKKVKRYIDIFLQENIKIYLYSELKNNKHVLLEDLFRFLGVDSHFKVNVNKIYNKAVMPRFSFVNVFLSKNSHLRRLINRYLVFLPHQLRQLLSTLFITEKNVQKLTKEDKIQLFQFYQKDIYKLTKLINLDLSHWEPK